MTNEEMERAIEFLVKNQASFDARLDQTNGQIAEMSKQIQIYAETQSEFIRIITRTLEAQAEINASLRAANTRTDERMNKTDERLDRMAAINSRTDERLDRMAATNAESYALLDKKIEEATARGAETDARLDRMAAMNARTDERLDRLAATVERNITGGNGSA
jgi:predicted nuclease with TOPRIM domain